jgi:hypothetical protein
MPPESSEWFTLAAWQPPRIIKLGPRLGDAAEMVLLELVED